MGPPANSSSQDARADDIAAAVRLLRAGGVVAVPTDTLYGLAASAFHVRGVERVYRIKGRSAAMALPLLLADPDDVALCAADVSRVALILAERFWPGPLTLVLRRSAVIPDAVTGGADTVALRVPDHPVPRALARGLGAPITGTSANRTGGPAPTTAGAVAAVLGDDVDQIIDAGECPGGVASTVLDLTGPTPVLVRAGAVPLGQVERVISGPVDR